MASAPNAGRPIVTATDLIRLLKQVHMERLWTYQEVMLSENPVLVCGTATLQWWRFVMGIIYLQATERESESYELFTLVRQWLSLARDRSKFQMAKSLGLDQAPYTILVSYESFLEKVAEVLDGRRWQISVLANLPWVTGMLLFFPGVPISFFVKTLPMLPAIFFGATVGLYAFNGILLCLYILVDSGLRRPQGRQEKFPQQSSTRDNILSAIWSRRCSDNRDVNFGTRNILKVYVNNLQPLDYSSDIGDAYRDLTANTLRLTESPELILAALRSSVPNAPSWTVDWSKRESLRMFPSKHPRSSSRLFYEITATPMPTGSWMHDPLDPKVLRVQGQSLGAVKAVVDLNRAWTLDGEEERRLTHIEYIEVLVGLQRLPMARLRGFFDHFNQYDCSPTDLFRMMFTPGRYRHGGKYLRGGLMECSDRVLFHEYKSFCATMKDRAIVMIDLDHSRDAKRWQRKYRSFVAKFHPLPLISHDSSHGSGALVTNDRYCRVRPGDKVLELQGLEVEAAVREEEEDQFVFVDAVESGHGTGVNRFIPFGIAQDKLRWFDIH